MEVRGVFWRIIIFSGLEGWSFVFICYSCHFKNRTILTFSRLV